MRGWSSCSSKRASGPRARGVNLSRLVRAPFGGRDENVGVPSRVHEALVLERFQEAQKSCTPGYCPMVGNYLKVLPNGDAYPCCRGPAELLLGNVFEQDFDQVWNGKAARDLRQGMITGEMPKVCVDCLVRVDPLMGGAIQHADRDERPQ